MGPVAKLLVATISVSIGVLACTAFGTRSDETPSLAPPSDAGPDSAASVDPGALPPLPRPPRASPGAKVAPNGHAYEVVRATSSTISWAEARDAAIAAGGHLVTFSDEEEQAFVGELLATQSAVYASRENYRLGPWLGAFQRAGSKEPDGGWAWVTGEPFLYSHWHAGEPNDGLVKENAREGVAIFAHLDAEGFADTWADTTDTDAIRAYVVEWEPSDAGAP